MRYSFIIPVYNRPEEVDELLNSLTMAKPDIELAYKAGWKKPERFVVKAADNITDQETDSGDAETQQGHFEKTPSETAPFLCFFVLLCDG